VTHMRWGSLFLIAAILVVNTGAAARENNRNIEPPCGPNSIARGSPRLLDQANVLRSLIRVSAEWSHGGQRRAEVATGFLIDRRTILTAAHALNDCRTGTEIDLFRADQWLASETPLRLPFARAACFPNPQTTIDRAWHIDLAIIRLSANAVTQRPAFMIAADPLQDAVPSRKVVLFGFRAPEALIRPAEAHGQLRCLQADRLFYDITTYDGQSGGPLIWRPISNGGRLIVAGIHVRARQPKLSTSRKAEQFYANATALTPELLRWVRNRQ
jgi:V8-like Glu-specific endopeptidase